MPRDIGPDMLANLDRQRAAGDITIAQYDARRVEVLELIRKGKAIEWTPAEKALIVVAVLAAFALAAFFLIASLPRGGLIGIALGVVLIVVGFVAAGRLR